LRRVLAEASDQLGAAVIELRQSILGLRRSDVKISSLVPAVRRVAAQFARLSRLSIELEIEGLDESDVGDRTLPAGYREHLLALLREGLSNAARHSGAREVHVMLALEHDTFILRISDQGAGFDPQAYLDGGADVRGVHHGLRNMKSRTEQLGGSFRVDSAPGQGTRLLFQIPIPQSSGGAQTDEQANAPGSGGR
ncbi:MAG: ATP-binding protein, partial [Firmicutes bacterium]|nr:ATP-binding protein [Bacillota bacterium]